MPFHQAFMFYLQARPGEIRVNEPGQFWIVAGNRVKQTHLHLFKENCSTRFSGGFFGPLQLVELL